MTSILIACLALFFAMYGLLLIVGGPQPANKMTGDVGRIVLGIIHGILRALIYLFLAILSFLVQFVFNRPRR